MADNRYTIQGDYIFQLRNGSDTVNFVLDPSPDQYVLTEPFAITSSPGLNGSLYVEENGIVYRRLTLSGISGMRPRRLRGGNIKADKTGVVRSSFSERIEDTRDLRYSGPRRFEFFQDHIFRAYGDRKRDPFKAEETELYFYNTKDLEHYRVMPETFITTRVARMLYRYQIQLLVVAPADQVPTVSRRRFAVQQGRKQGARSRDETGRKSQGGEDLISGIEQRYGGRDPLLADVPDEIENNLKDIEDSNFIERLDTTIANELRALRNSPLASAVQTVQGFVNDARMIAAKVQDFITGVTDFIKAPLDLISNALDTATTIISSLKDQLIGFGNAVLGSFRRLSRALSTIMALPQNFFENTVVKTRNYERLLFPDFFDADQPNLDENVREKPERDIGTAPTAAQSAVALNSPQPPPGGTQSNLPVVPRTVGIGDSIQGIAARYLGDVTRWRDLVALNGLAPPYVSETGQPGTLRPGDDILVPDGDGVDESVSPPWIVGAAPDDPIEERLLGVDFKLTENADGLFDWELSPDGSDLKRVAGVPNLEQGLRSRILQPLRELPILPNFGTETQVGRANTVGVSLARANIIASVEADPRIARTQRVRTPLNEQSDIIAVEFDAVVAGLKRSEVVEVTL